MAKIILEIEADPTGLAPAAAAIKQIGKLTDELYAKLQAANNAYKQTTQSIAAGATQAAAAQNNLNASVANFSNMLKNVNAQLAVGAMKTATNDLLDFAGQLSKAGTNATTLSAALTKLQGAIDGTNDSFADGLGLLTEYAQKVLGVTQNMGHLADATKKTEGALAKTERVFSTTGAGLKLVKDALKAFGVESEVLTLGLDKLHDATTLLEDIKKLAGLFDATAVGAKAAAVGEVAMEGATIGATTAMTGLKLAIASTGIGLLVIGLGSLAAAMSDTGEETDKAADSADNFDRGVVEEIANLKVLTTIAQDETVSKKKRKEAITELNRIAPEYLSNLTLENINTETARKSLDAYTDSLIANAKALAAKNKLVDVEGDLLDAEAAGIDIEKIKKRLEADIKAAEDGIKPVDIKLYTKQLDKTNLKLNETTGYLEDAKGNVYSIQGDLIKASDAVEDIVEETGKMSDEEFKVYELLQKQANLLQIITDYKIKYNKIATPPANTGPAKPKDEPEKPRDKITPVEGIKSIAASPVPTSGGMEIQAVPQSVMDANLKEYQDYLDKKKAADEDYEKQKIEFAFEAAKQTLDALFEITNAQRNAQFESQIADLEKEKSAKLDNENLTAGQKKTITEKYDKDIKQVKIKQFKADKDAKIAAALADGAAAAIKLLVTVPPVTTLGLPNPGYFIGLGTIAVNTALGVAKIASTPIPKFATGTRNAPAGFKWVGEQGPELINTPGNHAIITAPESAHIAAIFDKYGLPSLQVPSFNAPAFSNLINMHNGGNASLNYDEMGRSIAKHLPEGTKVNINMDKDGMHAYVVRSTSRVNYNNNKFRFN